MVFEATTRITLQEAATFAGIGLSILESAAKRHELRYVFSGTARELRTTPRWLGVWRTGIDGGALQWPGR
jgi:hypothetical protein